MKIPIPEFIKDHWLSTSLTLALGALGLHNYLEDHTVTRNRLQRAAEAITTDVVDDTFGLFGKELSFHIEDEPSNEDPTLPGASHVVGTVVQLAPLTPEN